VTAFEHLLTALLVLVLPALSAWDVPRLARRIAADPLNARVNAYCWNMAILWGLTMALVAGWWWAGRPVREVGLQLPGNAAGWLWTLLICCAVIAFLAQQAYSVAMSPEAQAKVREQLESQQAIVTVLPSTPREARVFFAAAITAGVCEEVLYRGYLLRYFQSLVPVGLAIPVAVVAFGAAHAYQGMRGILSTSAAGAFAMALYLLTGSLLGPIVLHAALDLVNGIAIYRVVRGAAAGAQ
jgi:membrane protease YdiL (CAAX protease family)